MNVRINFLFYFKNEIFLVYSYNIWLYVSVVYICIGIYNYVFYVRIYKMDKCYFLVLVYI